MFELLAPNRSNCLSESGKSEKIEPVSKPEWPGLHSKKFKSHLNRVRAHESIGPGMEGQEQKVVGRKHFEEKYSAKIVWKPSIKAEQEKLLRSKVFEGESRNTSKFLKLPYQKLDKAGNRTAYSPEESQNPEHLLTSYREHMAVNQGPKIPHLRPGSAFSANSFYSSQNGRNLKYLKRETDPALARKLMMEHYEELRASENSQNESQGLPSFRGNAKKRVLSGKAQWETGRNSQKNTKASEVSRVVSANNQRNHY